MTTSQKHGIIWESQVVDYIEKKYNTKFDFTGYSPTAKWDIPANEELDLPVSVKAQKEGSSIGNGSAIRTFQTDEDFMLAVVFYKQDGNIKKVTSSDLIKITKEKWNEMKGELTADVIIRLEKKLKSFKKGEHEAARKWYKKINRRYITHLKTDFKLAFKVDSKTQRRIQATFKIETIKKVENINTLNLTDLESGVRVFRK